MWDSLHTHTHHTINQIGVSQSPPLKSLTSSLGPTLWGSVSEPTRDYQAGSDTICKDPRKSASHICAIPQKDQSLLRLLVVVNKTQIYPINTRCGTHYTPTHITQSIKLGYHTWACARPGSRASLGSGDFFSLISIFSDVLVVFFLSDLIFSLFSVSGFFFSLIVL